MDSLYGVSKYTLRRGASFIDLLISLGIVVFLFGGIYFVFFSILGAASNIEARTAAAELLGQQVETIRGMSYDAVGTVGGVPAGAIPQQQVISVGGLDFTLSTTIRNIDDPFDGTAGGNPNDTAPADYKIVQFNVDCPSCIRFMPFTFSTTVAPKNLESSNLNGSLFINVFNALAIGVADADVHVVNSSVTPSIDLTDTTNASGVLQLVGVPTSTQSYQITVTKSGYSTDKTYVPGGAGNPNPLKPHATVAAQTVTIVSSAIDRTSAININSSDEFCSPVGNQNFSFQGSKLIGINPDVLKFSTSSATNASGSISFSNVEWDTYSFSFSTSSYDIRGTIPLTPIFIHPTSTINLRFVLKPSADPALLVNVIDSQSGDGIPGAFVALSGSGGFNQTLITGHAFRTDTDWSGSTYASQDGGIDAESVPGKFTLLANASGTYNTAAASWLISNSIDFGGTSSTIYSVSWNPLSQFPQTGPQSLQIQLAANNDNTTWNFIGPDGTAGTSFTATGTTPGVLNGGRYLRYKVFLSTADASSTPELHDITFDFSSACVPPAQSLFTNLGQGTYTLSVTAANYTGATSSVEIGSGFSQTAISLVRL